MKMKKYFMMCFVLLLLTSTSHAKVYTIATGEYAPFTSEKMEGFGLASEIVSAALAEMGHESKYKFFPWKRAKMMTEHGNFIATIPWGVTEERLKSFTFSEMFCNSPTKLFYFNDKLKGTSFNELKDLKKYRIGGSASYAYTEKFKKQGVKLDLAPTDEIGFRKLKAGRLDFFPCSEIVGRQLIRNFFPEEMNKFSVIEKSVEELDMGLMISKKHPEAREFKEMFNEGLKIIKEHGTYTKILEKYGITK